MNITLISHIYNEEYLLPFWLEYHKKIFKNGIIIDYNSTDNSLKIIKDICPDWKIIKSVNSEFGSEDIDKEVMNIENEISGYKIVLNVTEFLITTRKIEDILSEYIYSIKPFAVARTDIKNVTNTKEFIQNFTNFNKDWRGGRRFIHKYSNGNYCIGRHKTNHINVTETNEIFIVWTGFYPWNEDMLKRKLQIQTRIPMKDKIIRAGYQHITNEIISNNEAIELMKNTIQQETIHPKFLNYTLSLFDKILIIGGNGYIGSSLYNFLKQKYTVDILDIVWNEKNTYTMDYKNITAEILDNYDTIILLAGNSSVKSSIDLKNTFTNNVSNFINLLCLLKEQKLIYASSGSVYGSINYMATEDTAIDNNSYNNYDLSKKVIDMYAKLSDKNIYGLRFGTVSGPSENLRNDLVINSMVASSISEKKIFLYAKESRRAILGLNDLNRAIERIINANDNDKKGIYNLCSFNTSIESIATKVSNILNSQIIEIDNLDTINEKNLNKTKYSFELDNSKFKRIFNFTFQDNFENIIEDLVKSNNSIIINNSTLDINKDCLWTCREKTECRVCSNKNIICILDLGLQPLANSFHNNVKDLEKYPLKLMLCNNCFHLQLSHIVNPDILFKNYIYVSGTSNTLIKYFEWFAQYTLNKQKMYDGTLSNIKVLEIACNDGSQLDVYSKYNYIKTIGVDPAENIYSISSKKNHKIYCDYWCDKICDIIIKEYTDVDIIIAENVFAHTEDIHLFLENCKRVMTEKSVLFIQTSQSNMILNNEYDTIYHEHLSFFSVKSMFTVVQKHGLYLNNVDKSDIHGTSFIFEISKTKNTQNINNMLLKETQLGLHSTDFYAKYSIACINNTDKLKRKLQEYKENGYKIISYGASAKGNTVLNFMNCDYIDYIVDDNNMKWGMYTPGTNIIVRQPSYLKYEINKIAILMLTWNFRDEIMRKVKDLNLNIEVEYIEYNSI